MLAEPVPDRFEEMLLTYWTRYLPVPPVTMMDNFFALGGTSSLAVQIAAAVESQTGVRLPLDVLFGSPNLKEQAAFLRNQLLARAEGFVAIAKAGGKRPIFFAIVERGMNPLGYGILAGYLHPEQPLYVIRDPGEPLTSRPYTSQEHELTADEYVKVIQLLQPEGPYFLVGMCQGAIIAFEMARLLERMGQTVGLLAILDTWPREHSRNRALLRTSRVRTFLKGMATGSNAARLSLLLRGLRKVTRRVIKGRSPDQILYEQVYWPKNYVPPKVDTAIHLFQRRERIPVYTPDPLFGWDRRTRGKVEIHPLTAPEHFLLFREPWIEELGLSMESVLSRVQTQVATVNGDR